jgi:hypothetical protein
MLRQDFWKSRAGGVLLIQGVKVAQFSKTLSVTFRKLVFAKEVTFIAPPLLAVAEIECGRAGCFEREHDSCSVVVSQYVPTQVVFVQTVRDYHNGTATRTIQAISDDVVEAVVDEFDSSDVFGVLDLERVVDDDEVGTVAGELAADRRGIDAAAGRAKSDTRA